MMLDAINWHSCFFLLFAAIACSFAVAVVVSSNVVRMAFYLIVSLASVAALFFLAGAEFVGAMQLMIYVGGTLVLLAFGVMLTARGPLVSIPTGGGQWILATIVGGSLLVVLVQTALSVGDWRGPTTPQAAAEQPANAPPLGLAMLGVRADQLDESNPRRREGMSGYLLPFEIVSVHLLVVLVGAAYLARAKR
ncbi:MAG: NADH-quinone oxidoreductase subunit J [Planctomycetia bacterium]|nr:NADH-quinone oxidoreductase subunit J [Planctomycetia bacterium]